MQTNTRAQFIINNVCVAALTLYIWEFIASVPQEIALYRRRAWDSPHVLLFALVVSKQERAPRAEVESVCRSAMPPCRPSCCPRTPSS